MVSRASSVLPPFRHRDSQRLLVSYAQAGEDVRLARVLWDRPPGLYVDVGAGDPVLDSVTKLFYDAGWHGINIEPGPAFDRLAPARPRDVNLRVAVGRQEGERDLWISAPDTGLTAFEPPPAELVPPGMRLERTRVSCRRLDAILEEHVGDASIDFLKIDVEGAEREALESIDLARFRPLVLVIEAIEPLTFEAAHESWEPLLLEADYVAATFDGINRFYVPREDAALREVLEYPLTLLDRYVSHLAEHAAVPETGGGGSSAFPTLAEQLSGRSQTTAAPSPLVAVVEPAVDVAEVERILPEGSVVVTASEQELRAVLDDRVRMLPGTLDALVGLVRDQDGDVLVVSQDGRRLTSPVLDGLRAALRDDSVCATVSVDDASRPVAAGLPPPGLLAPTPGVVLVSRDHFLLAADERHLAGSSASSPATEVFGGGLSGRVLALLDRPGFVHRGYGEQGHVPSARLDRPRPRSQPGGARIVIDGRCLAYAMAGTQVQVLGLVGGLARAGADVSVLAPTKIHPSVRAAIARTANGVPFVEWADVGRPHVFHRPYQLWSQDELIDCLRIGERFVLTHQDMILDRVRAYHVDEGAWHDYRRATSAALASADAVGFFSQHAACDATSDGMLELDRATVVPLGVDHLAARAPAAGSADPLGGRPYLLVAGSTFWHKNRLFALRVLAWLIEHHGWDGGLVFVGGHVGRGSSVAAEQALLARSPALRDRVVDLGHVTEDEQLALYRDAALVLFPSLYEGFGFIPYEAAALGTACVYVARGPMQELLPPAGALPSFDVDAAGAFVFRLLEHPEERERVVHEITKAARELTWDRTAAGYLEVYGRALGGSPKGMHRGLLTRLPTREKVLDTRAEVVLVDIYRRRRGFRLAVGAVLRSGRAVTKAGRRLRRGGSAGS